MQGRIAANSRITNSAQSAKMNVKKPIGADLTMTKNFDTAQVRQVIDAIGSEDENKVFYNTGGFKLKNSLSNATGAKPLPIKKNSQARRIPTSLEHEMK